VYYSSLIKYRSFLTGVLYVYFDVNIVKSIYINQLILDINTGVYNLQKLPLQQYFQYPRSVMPVNNIIEVVSEPRLHDFPQKLSQQTPVRFISDIRKDLLKAIKANNAELIVQNLDQLIYNLIKSSLDLNYNRLLLQSSLSPALKEAENSFIEFFTDKGYLDRVRNLTTYSSSLKSACNQLLTKYQ